MRGGGSDWCSSDRDWSEVRDVAGGSSNRATRLRLEWASSVRDGFPSDGASSDARGGRSDLFASRRFGFPYRTTFRILVLCERKAFAKGSGPTISVTPVSFAVSRQERLRSAPCFPRIQTSSPVRQGI